MKIDKTKIKRQICDYSGKLEHFYQYVIEQADKI